MICALWHVHQFPLASWSVLGQNSLFQVLSEWIVVGQSSVASRPVCPYAEVVTNRSEALKYHVLGH